MQKLSPECDRCGACCGSFPIYASDKDAEREPRIVHNSLRLYEWLGDEEWRYQLYPLPFHTGCCFLGEDKLCTIYETRPEVCRRFEPGSEQCSEARKRRGLMPLLT